MFRIRVPFISPTPTFPHLVLVPKRTISLVNFQASRWQNCPHCSGIQWSLLNTRFGKRCGWMCLYAAGCQQGEHRRGGLRRVWGISNRDVGASTAEWPWSHFRVAHLSYLKNTSIFGCSISRWWTVHTPLYAHSHTHVFTLAIYFF